MLIILIILETIMECKQAHTYVESGGLLSFLSHRVQGGSLLSPTASEAAAKWRKLWERYVHQRVEEGWGGVIQDYLNDDSGGPIVPEDSPLQRTIIWISFIPVKDSPISQSNQSGPQCH